LRQFRLYANRLCQITALLVYAGACGPEPVNRETVKLSEACPPVQWTDPTSVSSDLAETAVARFPSVGVFGSKRFILGNDVRDVADSMVPAGPFVAWNESGESIGRPSGSFNFVFPRAFVANDGSLHMVWGEPAGGARDIHWQEWPPRAIVRVWTAAYSAGGWGDPSLLYEGPELDWEGASIADRSNGSDLLAVVAGPSWRSVAREVMRFSFDGDRWSGTAIGVTGTVGGILSPAYAARGNRHYLAFLGGGPQSGDVNSVWLQSSNDSGVTWEAPHLVSRSGAAGAYEVKALIGPRNDLRLVWLQAVSGTAATSRPSIVRHRISSDHGANWSPPQDAGPPAWRAHLRAAVDQCARTHVLYADFSEGPELAKVAFRSLDGDWTVGQPLFPDIIVSNAADFRANSTALHAVVLGRPRNSVTSSALQTFHALAPLSR
jgi:hypothetical protein